MMKKLIVLSLLAVLACNKKEGTKEADNAASSVKAGAATTNVIPTKVGSDKDLHGCKASAGYTWSAVIGECIRVFEIGERLDAVDDQDNAVMPVFVVFKGNKAEVFISTEKAPLVLERKASGLPYMKDDWELSSAKIPHLKKSGKLLFSGD